MRPKASSLIVCLFRYEGVISALNVFDFRMLLET